MLIDVLDRIHVTLEVLSTGVWAAVIIQAGVFVHNVYTRRSRG